MGDNLAKIALISIGAVFLLVVGIVAFAVMADVRNK